MAPKKSFKLLLSLTLLCIFHLPTLALSAEKTATFPAENRVQTTAAKTTQQRYPRRGMSMQQVRKHYGKAQSVSHSKGKKSKRWPRITRWHYGRFSVYFERQTVLHTVVH